MDDKFPHPTLEDIRLDDVSATSWRVTDRRFRETNPRSALGFIEWVNGHFEVTDVRKPSERVAYDTRDAALASFAVREPAIFQPS